MVTFTQSWKVRLFSFRILLEQCSLNTEMRSGGRGERSGQRGSVPTTRPPQKILNSARGYRAQ